MFQTFRIVISLLGSLSYIDRVVLYVVTILCVHVADVRLFTDVIKHALLLCLPSPIYLIDATALKFYSLIHNSYNTSLCSTWRPRQEVSSYTDSGSFVYLEIMCVPELVSITISFIACRNGSNITLPVYFAIIFCI